MKATLALLVDHQAQNEAQKLAWYLYNTYHVSLETSRLPSHISLKQPFTIDDLDALESYATAFSSQIPADTISFSHIEAFSPNATTAPLIIWFALREPSWLRGLHTQLNDDMRHLFNSTNAPFDGSAYQFHLTIAISSVDEQTRTTLTSVYHGQPLSLVARPQGLALFVYDDTKTVSTDYMMYAVIPLTR